MEGEVSVIGSHLQVNFYLYIGVISIPGRGAESGRGRSRRGRGGGAAGGVERARLLVATGRWEFLPQTQLDFESAAAVATFKTYDIIIKKMAIISRYRIWTRNLPLRFKRAPSEYAIA